MPRLQNSFMIAFNNDETTPGFAERWLRNLYLSIVDQSTLEAYYKKNNTIEAPNSATLINLISQENWSIFSDKKNTPPMPRRPYKWITTPFVFLIEAISNTLAEVTLSANIGLDTWKRNTLKDMKTGASKSITAGFFNVVKFFAVGFHTITSSFSFVGHFFNRMTNNFSRNPATSTGATVLGVSASIIVGGTLGLAALLSNPIGWGIILIGGPILLAALASDVYSIYQDRQIDRQTLTASNAANNAAKSALDMIKHGKNVNKLKAEATSEDEQRELGEIQQDQSNEERDFKLAFDSYRKFIKLVTLPILEKNLIEALGTVTKERNFEFKATCYSLALKVGDSDRATGIQLLNEIGLTAPPETIEDNLSFSVLASGRLAWIITRTPKNPGGIIHDSNARRPTTPTNTNNSSTAQTDTANQNTTPTTEEEEDLGPTRLFDQQQQSGTVSSQQDVTPVNNNNSNAAPTNTANQDQARSTQEEDDFGLTELFEQQPQSATVSSQQAVTPVNNNNSNAAQTSLLLARTFVGSQSAATPTSDNTPTASSAATAQSAKKLGEQASVIAGQNNNPLANQGNGHGGQNVRTDDPITTAAFKK
jgi:hypothetical protein